ncbi:Rpn family recombination-promoting nuclease/putative transposase [Marinospirillum sp. MEB164]|uniref:Rpn family recombination-promoting nuclease/putative transposase n=1 Tax=Marinospirillum alkalitolerans TaxID=3123374 RepID=A0ABW8PUY8_9GAMM
MTNKHHDTGYKEVFSYPEFVQQLIEGFAPQEIAELMDFTTLKQHNGHYITPLFEEKLEDVVWSVEIIYPSSELDQPEQRQKIYLYILLEFQSRIDQTMPIRLMHYVACFYDHLLKSTSLTPSEGLPPVFPVVLYNGSRRWSAPQDIYTMIQPEPPSFLRAYQPHLRYYLIDEGAYSDAQLGLTPSPLSGMFSVENAGESWESLQRAVDRIVAIIQADPNKERLDRVITRWIKRHLSRLGVDIQLDQLNSLIEDKDMLAENLENLVKKERAEGIEQGIEQGYQKAQAEAEAEKQKLRDAMVLNMLQAGLPDSQVMSIAQITADELAAIKEQQTRH